MPHLLRSTTSLNGPYPRPLEVVTLIPGRRNTGGPPEVRSDPDLEPLRRQVSAIIDAILSDTSPEEAQVREKLRWHVANNPGQPEKALLNHCCLCPWSRKPASWRPVQRRRQRLMVACRTTSPQDCWARSATEARISDGGRDRSSGNSTMSMSVLRIRRSLISPAPG